MSQRFGEHAPFWQFVIWGRQLVLTLLVLFPSFIGIEEEVEAIGVAANASLAMTNESLSEAQLMQSEQQRLEAVRWPQVGVALLVLLLSALWTARSLPFYSAFQNWIELWLLGSSGLVIILAFAYTHFPASHLPLEIALTSFLVVSTLAAALYLFVHYRRQVKRATEEAARRASAAAKRASQRASVSARRLSSRASFSVRPRDSRAAAQPKASNSAEALETTQLSIRSSVLDRLRSFSSRASSSQRPPPPPPEPPPPPDEPPPPDMPPPSYKGASSTHVVDKVKIDEWEPVPSHVPNTRIVWHDRL